MTTNTDAEVEVACGSQEEDPRPKDSPYSSPLVHVLFDSGREFLVPKDILCKKIPSLPVVDVWMPTPGNCKTCRGPRGPGGFEKQAKLGHLSQEVGHILIHYLFTNEYESLQPSGESLEEKQESEFVTAIQAADAAQIYKLPTLANLAVMEIRRLGDKLSFLRLVDLIEQTSKQILHQPDVLAYVDCRIQALCNDLTASLADELLFELGTPTTVSRALFKSLIGLRKKDLATEKYRVQLGSEDEESSGGDCDLKPASCTSSLVFPKMNHVPVHPPPGSLMSKKEMKRLKGRKRREERAMMAERALEEERVLAEERAVALHAANSAEPPWFDCSAEEVDSEVSDGFVL